jgi:hypothetical protein
MEKVVFAADCEECPDCGEPWCERHKAHYADCACIGPTEEDVAYQEIDGVLYGRRQNQNGS